MATCNNCGATVSDAAKFCTECGKMIEKKSVCVNCGAKLRDGAKFCVECGTPIPKQEPQKETVLQKDIVEVNENLLSSLNNLNDTFEEFLELQRENPDVLFTIDLDYDMNDEDLENMDGDDVMEMLESSQTEEDDTLSRLLNGITNCCFSPENGNELFTNNGNPQLMMELVFYDVYNNRDMERLQKLQTLSIYSKFIHLRVDTDRSPYVHWLYVNCGEDCETMVEIFKSLAVDVYGIDFTREWNFTILPSDKKKVIQKKTEKIAKDNVKNHHLRVVRIQ